jgi:hypothetical protein
VPAVIRRSIIYAVEGGQVVARDLGAIGQAAQAAEQGIVRGAANSNSALRQTGEAAEGMSGRSRAAFLNISNQFQDFIVQTTGGTDALKAFAQQAPQALDAVAMAAGGLNPAIGLAAAGIATLASLAPALIPLVTGHEDAAKAAEDQRKRTDELLGSLNVTAKGADDFAASIANLTGHQRELAAADLAATVQAQQKALEDAAKTADDLIAKRGQGAAANVAVAGAFAAGEVGAVPQETVQAIQGIQKATADVQRSFDDFDKGKIKLDELKNAIVELQQPAEMSAEEFRKFQQSLLDAASAKEVARRNAELYTAQLHLMLDEMGQHGVFTAHDRDVLDTAQSYDTAKAAAKSYKDELASLKEQQHLAGLGKDEQFVANAIQKGGGDDLTETQRATIALRAGDKLAAEHAAEDVAKQAEVEKRLAEVRRELADSTDAVAAAGDKLAASIRDAGGTEQQIEQARRLGQARSQDAEFAKADAEARKAAADERAAYDAEFTKADAEANQAREQERENARRSAQQVANSLANADQELAARQRELAASGDKVAEAAARAEDAMRRQLTVDGQLIPGAERRIALAGQEATAAERQRQAQEDAKKAQEDAQRAADAFARQGQENQKTLSGLMAQGEQRANDLAAAIKAAGAAAADRIKLPTVEQLDKPGGAEALEGASADRDAARAQGERNAALQAYDKIISALQPSQQKFAQELADTNDLLDSGKLSTEEQSRLIGVITGRVTAATEVERARNQVLAELNDLLVRGKITQDDYNKSVERANQDADISLARARQADRQAREGAAFARSSNAGDAGDIGTEWAQGALGGLLQIEAQADETGRNIGSALSQGFDQAIAAQVEMINGGETGFADLKQAALGFVTSLEAILLKELEIRAVQALLSAFMGGGAGTTAGFFHSGGMVGEGAPSRALPPMLFAAAPRAHAGLDLATDEVPIVAKRGERVLNPAQTREWNAGARGGSGGGTVVINHAPVYNISGVNDPAMLRQIVDMSSAKANTDLERRFRDKPETRRALVSH